MKNIFESIEKEKDEEENKSIIKIKKYFDMKNYEVYNMYYTTIFGKDVYLYNKKV